MRHLFIQRFVKHHGELVAREEPTVDQRRREAKHLKPPYIERRGKRLALAKRGFGMAVRWTGRGIYVSPLWLVAQAVLKAAGETGDLAIVGFVLTVCLFFAALNCYVWIAAIHYLVARTQSVKMPAGADGSDLLGLLVVRDKPVIGTVARLTPSVEGDHVIRDVWSLDASPKRRIVEADDFVIVPDDAESTPVVCRIESAPILVGIPHEVQSDASGLGPSASPELGDVQRAQLITLREGDRVELYAPRLDDIPRLDHIKLGEFIRRYEPHESERSPYRGAGTTPGRLATSLGSRPIALRIRPRVI